MAGHPLIAKPVRLTHVGYISPFLWELAQRLPIKMWLRCLGTSGPPIKVTWMERQGNKWEGWLSRQRGRLYWKAEMGLPNEPDGESTRPPLPLSLWLPSLKGISTVDPVCFLRFSFSSWHWAGPCGTPEHRSLSNSCSSGKGGDAETRQEQVKKQQCSLGAGSWFRLKGYT